MAILLWAGVLIANIYCAIWNYDNYNPHIFVVLNFVGAFVSAIQLAKEILN